MSPRPQPTSKPVPTLDLHALTTTYSNYFRASGSADEVILDFGVDGHHHNANGPEPIQLLQRVALSWSNAQQLLLALQQLIQQRRHTQAGNPSDHTNRPPHPPSSGQQSHDSEKPAL